MNKTQTSIWLEAWGEKMQKLLSLGASPINCDWRSGRLTTRKQNLYTYHDQIYQAIVATPNL